MKEKNANEKLEKVKIVSIWILSILLIISIFQRSGIIKNIQNTSKNLLNNGEMATLEDGQVTRTVNSSNWDTSKVTVTKDAEGKEVPVPKGYVGSSVAGENKVNEGYVIYEGTEAVTSSNVASARLSRNQWVWIPVPYPDRIYEEKNGVKIAKLYNFGASGRSLFENRNYEPAIAPEFDTTTNLTNGGLSGMTPDKLYQELQHEFDSTIESIKRYGGFYIGRYETGNLSQIKPVVRKMNTDITNQTWYSMYSKAGYLAANLNTKTNMIWGCLWDETMQWLVDRYNKVYSQLSVNSSDWGNFYQLTSVIISTGSNESTKALNIYDLAGNVWEWTLEGSGTACRVFRGGGGYDAYSMYAASSRSSWVKPSTMMNTAGYRAYLYIK